MPITAIGVAIASANSALLLMTVTLLMPEIGKPVLGSIVCEYFFPVNQDVFFIVARSATALLDISM